jgi:putative ABC transport system permease protein
MNPFLRRLRWLVQRPDKEAELREELQFHLAEDADERRADGVADAEARWAARRELGNLTLVAESTRASWGWTRLEQVARDVGYGLRQVRRNRGFSLIAIATLALGIGGVAAIFSAFDAVLVRPLPYADADRLVMVWDNLDRKGGKSFPAPAEWLAWRRDNTVFADIALTQPGTATLSGDGEPEQVPARKASGNLWSVLGVSPLLGRVFTEEEDDKGVRVAVISHGLWQRRYGGSPDVVGRTITVNDIPYDVIGVMPSEFYFMPSREIAIWLPASLPDWQRRHFSWHDGQVVARLRPGVTLEQARQGMATLSLHVTEKDFRGPHSVIVAPLREELAGKARTALVLLMWAAAALLLIACVNLANLQMSRGVARGREVAVRAALGAGRGRLAAQFLTESLVLAVLGTVAGLALAVPLMRVLETLVPETMGAVRLTLDWRVLSCAAGAGIAAVLTFGLMPAVRGARLSPQAGRIAFVAAQLEAIRAIPGVVNAGATSQVPLKLNDPQATFYMLEGQSEDNVRGQVAHMRVVTRDYLATIGARLREGRLFETSDQGSDAKLAIVNETFAKRSYPGRPAVGQRFKYGNLDDEGYWYTIVGVVREIHEGGIEEARRPVVYRLLEHADQVGSEPSGIVVRTSVDPESIVPGVRQAIWSLDRNQPIARVQTVEDMVARQLATTSQSSGILSAFALLALLLASLGLYGVLSYAVTQRTSEIGVRMALGASSRDILLSFGKRGMVLTTAGLAIGLVLAAIAARSMTTLFFGFRPDYVPAAAVVSVVLMAVAALASVVPARRASRIDPILALQRE